MTKEKCLWKGISDNPKSTTTQDMVKRPDVKCFKCKGYDLKCQKYIPDPKEERR
jgi:hypothetical protein